MDLPIEMYKMYVERRKQDYEKLEKAISESSVEEFKRIGHQLKGNASSFGFDDLGVLGEEMEKLTLAQLPTEGTAILQKFQTWMTKAEKQFSGM